MTRYNGRKGTRKEGNQLYREQGTKGTRYRGDNIQREQGTMGTRHEGDTLLKVSTVAPRPRYQLVS